MDDKDKKETKKEPLPLKDFPEAVNAVVFTPDSSQVLAVGYDHMLRFYNVADGKETKKIGPTKDWLNSVAISKDGKLVATGGYGGSLRVYELGSGKEVFKLDRKGMISYGLAFSPDGKALVTGHEKDNVARVTSLDAPQTKEAPKEETKKEETKKDKK